MKLADLLVPECVRVPLQAAAKNDAIAELVDILAEHGRISDRDSVLKAVMEREATRSTGIGHGLAVPHCKSPACTSLVMAIGKPAAPLDFNSVDGRPVSLVVLLVSPLDQTGPHIQALAHISCLMLTEPFRTEIDQARSADQILNIIARYEA